MELHANPAGPPVGGDGKYLYPAWPYPWFTRRTRSDVDADTVASVRDDLHEHGPRFTHLISQSLH
ncbi:MAG TPA: hypothetical protein VL024_03395 [Castellaniella sp.]|nr:hypothetical protein [Castellaniella sp.]